MYVLRAACLAIKNVISPSAKKRVAENVQIKWLLGNDYAYVYTNNPNAYIKLKRTEKTKKQTNKRNYCSPRGFAFCQATTANKNLFLMTYLMK